MKRLITILLLSVMLLTTLVACGGDDKKSGDGGISDESTYLPNVDFEGYAFRVLHTDGGKISAIDDEDADETSILYQASVERDSEMIDRFNIKIEDVESGSSNGITDYVTKDALAGECSSYDIGCIAGGKEQASEIISSNLAEDAKSMPMLDLSKEWYAQQANEEYNIYGKQFFFAGAYPFLPGSPSFLFNKDFIREKNMELPYDLILSGNWTIEELMKYTTVGYSNFNSADGSIDGLDKFGYAGHVRSVCYFYQGFGGQTTYRTSDGSVKPVLASDTIDAMYDKVTEFYNHKANWTNSSLDAGDRTSSHKVFYDGRAMFCYWVTGTLSHEEIETFEKGLGILPKYNLDQDNYCCPVAGGTLLFPTNLEDPYTTGYIYESICEASWRIVYPASIQEARAFETLTDEESILVKKLVDQSLTYDILKDCDPTGGVLGSCGFIWECIQNDMPPSVLAQSYEAYNIVFDEFFEAVRDKINKDNNN